MATFAAEPPTRTFGGSVDMEVLNDRLWPVFVRGALRGTHPTSTDPIASMKKREFLRLLEGCAPPEQLTVVYHAEAGRTLKRTFSFSAFKRALCVVAARLQRVAGAPSLSSTAIEVTQKLYSSRAVCT